MRIGVLRDHAIKRIMFSYKNANYAIYGDSLDLGFFGANEYIEVQQLDTRVILKKGAIELGKFQKVYLIQQNENTSLVLTPKSPVLKQRSYEGDFEIFSSGKNVTIVNLVDIDSYLAGVVESEGGGGQRNEYYKVQALMSRTYALKYLGKHKKEGFDLCDRVHCQAYHNMLRFSSEIQTAVNQTHNLVLVDKQNELIDAYFHANCGGQTCEPQLVWNDSISYLNTFLDTFCLFTKNADWEKRISKEKWRNFLTNKYHFPSDDSVYEGMMYTFKQPQRMAFFLHPVFGIPLRDIREEFGLKSTFFSCFPEGDEIVLKGRGYGHGVGLCQEGAIKMAKYGYDFRQISRFYFPGTNIVNYESELFFSQ